MDEKDAGCVCAAHMEGDYAGPRAREKTLQHKARRRKTCPFNRSPGWRMSGSPAHNSLTMRG